MRRERNKIYIVGCGPGDPELLTIKAYRLIREAEVLLYTGSLLNREIISLASNAREKHDTSKMSEEEILGVLLESYDKNRLCVWAHDGDPTIFGGIAGIVKKLREKNVPYEIVPGVSSVTASAAVLGVPLTVPGYAQAVIIANPSSLESLIEHGVVLRSVSLVTLLAAKRVNDVVETLVKAGLPRNSVVGIVHRATWKNQVARITELNKLPKLVDELGLSSCLTILVSPSTRIDEVEIPKTKVYGAKK